MALLCERPVNIKGVLFSCGKCELCKLKKKSDWNLRLKLQAETSGGYSNCSFLTLTYDDFNCPANLEYSHFQKFIRKFRKVFKERFSYFVAGEYGDKFKRPHYHAIFFGVKCDESIRLLVKKCWNRGFIVISPLTKERCNYTCGYVQKKLDKDSSNYSVPEFAHMSLKPAIGLDWFYKNKDWLKDRTSIVFGGKKQILPQFFRRKLSKEFEDYNERLIHEFKQRDIEKCEKLGYDISSIEWDDYWKNVNIQKCIDLKCKRNLFKRG